MTSWDIATTGTLGTGTSKTQINGSNPLTKPTQAANLIEVVPYMAASAAHTAAETMLVKWTIESNSINLLPKESIVPPIAGGLGTFGAAEVPILESYICNTPLQPASTQQFKVYGTPQVSNTAAPRMGMAFHYSTASPVNSEHFYTTPSSETSTGTAATSVAGGTMTINDGLWLEDLYAVVTPGTVTASESYIGYMDFSSNDFENSMPLKIPIQPVAAGLGSAISIHMPKMFSVHNVHMGMKSTVTLNTAYNQEEALTAAANFYTSVGYTKTG